MINYIFNSPNEVYDKYVCIGSFVILFIIISLTLVFTIKVLKEKK